LEILYTCLEEELENMCYEVPEIDEIRDNLERKVKEDEIKEENENNNKIELHHYMVFDEQDKTNQDTGNKYALEECFYEYNDY
jgi:hypothetical protein